ncbi:MAG: hypothetical protein M1833_005705 [Piccolia ochrophora]|nr:MAG: hypothetical protein M1833_005705 [Piccolia ochrophora]
MRYSVVAAALVAGAVATYHPPKNETSSAEPTKSEHPVYTTEVVTEYTTYCPGPTEVVHGEKTYTVTEATTLTITDCPCTVTKPIYTAPPAPETHVPAPPAETHVPAPPAETHVPAPPAETHVPAPETTVSVAPAPTANGTVPIVAPVGPTEAPVAPGTPAPTFTGAANKAFAASGAGLAGLAGLLAYVL